MFGAALDELKTNGTVVENYGRSSKQNRKFILREPKKDRDGGRCSCVNPALGGGDDQGRTLLCVPGCPELHRKDNI